MRPCVILVVLAALCVSAVGAAAPRDPAGPLDRLLDRVRELHRQKLSPVVVFDLDDTLFRVGYRTRKILIDWAARLSPAQARLKHRLEAMDGNAMPYSPKALLADLKLDDPLLTRSALVHWWAYFFSGLYLSEDRPLAGAIEYVGALARAGARIVYLTGRDEPRMGPGTRRQIEASGYPRLSRTVRLLLKPSTAMGDLAFKNLAIAEVRRMGTVVASFDNEPANVNLFRRAFPDAIVVYLDTVHSDNAPPLDAGIEKIRDYVSR